MTGCFRPLFLHFFQSPGQVAYLKFISPSRPEQSLTFNPSIQSTGFICYLYPLEKTHWDSVFFFLRLNFKQCLPNCSLLSLPPIWSSAPSPPPVSPVSFVKFKSQMMLILLYLLSFTLILVLRQVGRHLIPLRVRQLLRFRRFQRFIL